MTWPILMALAGVMGAAGVVLAAAGAHSRPDAGLDNASQMLLVHALAVIAIGAAAGQGLLVRPLALAAVIGLVCGSALFAGDLVLRAYAGTRLFPMAAPTGGMVLIVSWIALAVAALATLRN